MADTTDARAHAQPLPPPLQAKQAVRGGEVEAPAKRAKGASAYMLFSEQRRPAVMAALRADAPDGKVSVTAAARALGEQWKALSEEEKAGYKEKAQQRAAGTCGCGCGAVSSGGLPVRVRVSVGRKGLLVLLPSPPSLARPQPPPCPHLPPVVVARVDAAAAAEAAAGEAGGEAGGADAAPSSAAPDGACCICCGCC
jgi:hypothetical protein